MNRRHSNVTDWGLAHVVVRTSDTVLDVGCGGGRTVSKLAALAKKVYGVDHSKESVTIATKINRKGIEAGRVEILEASVSRLPFPPDIFDLITAVETHFWWPDLPSDTREVFRVLKPGGTLVVIAEIYKGATTSTARLAEKYLPSSGLALLSVDEHRELLGLAGFRDIQISTEPPKRVALLCRQQVDRGADVCRTELRKKVRYSLLLVSASLGMTASGCRSACMVLA